MIWRHHTGANISCKKTQELQNTCLACEIKSVSDSRSSLYSRKMSLHPPPPRVPGTELKLKHVVLLLGQLGHLLADRPHQRGGGEAAQGHVVHVLSHRGQVLLGGCAVGGGGQLRRLVILQGQPGVAPLGVARMRESLHISRQRQLKQT